MKRIKVRPKITFSRKNRYSEELDDFVETTIHLFGDAVLGAMLTLVGVLFSTNSIVEELFSDLVMTLSCVILVLSVCLLLGYMLVMTLGKSDKHRKDCNEQ
jgi:hypothetical protein